MDKGCKDEIRPKLLEVDQDGKVEVYMTLDLNGKEVKISFSQAREIWKRLSELFEEEEEEVLAPMPTMWPITIPNPLVDDMPNTRPWGPLYYERSQVDASKSEEEGNEMVS